MDLMALVKHRTQSIFNATMEFLISFKCFEEQQY